MRGARLAVMTTLGLLSHSPLAAGLKEAKEQEGAVAGEREFARCLKVPASRKVRVTLKPSTEVGDLVAWISAMTCRRFILPEKLAAQRVTLISPGQITAREAYRAFISALDVMGLTVIRAGRSLKVVPASAALHGPVRTFTDKQRGELPASEEVVTQIVRLRAADVGTILPVVLKLKSQHGDAMAFSATNALILTDGASNVRRIVEIVEQLDVPGERDAIRLLPLEHAEAAEAERLVKQLFPAGQGAKSSGAGRAGPLILADPGTNALIVVAEAEVFDRIADLVRQLDVEGDGGRSKVWVYRLEHADAEQLARAITGLDQGAARKGKGQRGPAPLFSGEVKVNADKSNNALIIVATTRDYLALRAVIRELDQPRRQVFVEAYILELRITRKRDLGLAFHGGISAADGDALFIGGLEHGTELNSLSPLSLMGLAAGVQGPVLAGTEQLASLASSSDSGGDDGSDDKKSAGGLPAFGVVIRALQETGDLNLLSAPHLLTTDNEEAEILVGEKIPVLSGTSGSIPGADQQTNLLLSLGQRVERTSVGLNLKLTPTIGEGDTVRLKIEQTASNVAEKNFGGLGASTLERLFRSVVTVQDQQTVVIGGLIREDEENGESKIPLLGDLPIIGRLFRYEKKARTKSNLMLVLTPYVIRDQSDLRRIFKRKIAERREFLRRYTAFRERYKGAQIDYRHKRGLLAEINRFGAEVEREVALERAAKVRSRARGRGSAPDRRAPSRPAPRGSAPAAP